MAKNDFRVVLTGGPGGGKTTAADLFRRQIGEGIVVVPESATLLYSGGFPRSHCTEVQKIAQKAIYQVQVCLEEAQSAEYPGRALLCDRGTIDGAAFWPGDPTDFFRSLSTTFEKELSRYDAVIFFETAAVGGISIEGGNPIRVENVEQATEIDRKLRKLWSQHPNFVFIPHTNSFLQKAESGLLEMQKVMGPYLRNAPRERPRPTL